METLGNIEIPKNPSMKYVCKVCDCKTSHLGDWNKHLSTAKHIKRAIEGTCPHKCSCGKVFTRIDNLNRHKKACELVNKPTAKVPEIPKCFQMFTETQIKHECECGSTYKSRSGLWKHKKTCLHGVAVTQPVDNTKVLDALTGLKDKLNKTESMLDEQAEDNKLLKEELSNLKAGVLTAVAEPKVININILLNDKCGDAIAIQDFAKSLMICMEDVNFALENGKVKGIENIIQKKFNELGVHKRPLHCTDVKRGTLYVKGEEGWEKEKGEMNKMIRDVECVQTTGIKVWSEANPEYSQGNQKLMEKWLRIVQCLTNSIDGIGIRKIEKRCQEMSKVIQEEIG
jgi:hypothetical protein